MIDESGGDVAIVDLDPVHGLLGHNNGVLNQMYDGSGNLVSATIYQYDTAAHATLNDGSTGVLHSWDLALGYTAGKITSESIAQAS